MATCFTAHHDAVTGLVQLIDTRGPRPMLLELLTRHQASLLAADLLGFPSTRKGQANLTREEEAAEAAARR